MPAHSLCGGNGQRAKDASDTTEDQEAIFALSDKGSDDRYDTERSETKLKYDRSGEEVTQSSSEEKERSETERIRRDDLLSAPAFINNTHPDELRHPEPRVETDLRDRHSRARDITDVDKCRNGEDE